MESQIIDYYNEMPYGVNVIEKMNEELEVVQAQIKELELELQKEKCKSEKMKAFTKPPCIDNEECDFDTFEKDIRHKFLEWCNNDLSDYERLSYKLMKDYKDYNITSYEYSLIRYIIHKLNECTHYPNIRWCELFVLTTLESHGITNKFPYWGAPMFEVENLLEDLCECEIPLLSIGMFER